jgi:hypothetical protein
MARLGRAAFSSALLSCAIQGMLVLCNLSGHDLLRTDGQLFVIIPEMIKLPQLLICVEGLLGK